MGVQIIIPGGQSVQTQHVHDVTIGGNTQGVGALVSSGTLFLAGGTNISLSQNQNSITIKGDTIPPIATTVSPVGPVNSIGNVTRFAPENHAHQGIAKVLITSGALSSTSFAGSLFLSALTQQTWLMTTATSGGTLALSIALAVPAVNWATAVSSVGITNVVGVATRAAREDHVHAGVNYIAGSGNTSGTSGPHRGGVVFVAGNNLSMSGSSPIGTASVATITLNAGAILSEFNPFEMQDAVTNATLAQNSLYFVPVSIPTGLYVYRINVFENVAYDISAVNNTGSAGVTRSAAIYARDTANTNRITMLWSGSFYMRLSCSSNTNISASHPIGISNSTAVSSTAYQSNNVNASTYVANSIAGLRVIPIPVSSTLSAGQYWIALAKSYTSANASFVVSMMDPYMSWANHVAYAPMGVSTGGTKWGPFQGLGNYSVTSGAFPASVTLNTDILNAPTAIIPLFNFSGWTTATSIL